MTHDCATRLCPANADVAVLIPAPSCRFPLRGASRIRRTELALRRAGKWPKAKAELDAVSEWVAENKPEDTALTKLRGDAMGLIHAE